MRSIPRALALAATLAATLGAPLAAPLGAQLVNGNFESSTPVAGSVDTYGAGSSFGGWTVGQGTIDLLNGYWQAADGTYSVDLDGVSVGSIYQDVATTIGEAYTLGFSLAGNPAGGPVIKTMDVLWGGSVVGSYTFDITGRSFAAMGWTPYTLAGLVSTTATTRLEFRSTTGGNFYGPAVDAITLAPAVSAVPEPATLALVAGGLALVGGVARRRRTH